MPRLILELGSAVKSGVVGHDDVAQSNLTSDTSTRARRDEHFGLNGSRHFSHQIADRRGRPVIVEMQPGLEYQHASAADDAWKIKAKTVVIARHLGLG